MLLHSLKPSFLCVTYSCLLNCYFWYGGIRLVGQVVTVSMETVRLVRALAASVALLEATVIEAAAT